MRSRRAGPNCNKQALSAATLARPQGVKLHAVVDACHSGSTFDLPYHAYIKNGRAQWRNSYERGTRVHKVGVLWAGSAGAQGMLCGSVQGAVPSTPSRGRLSLILPVLCRRARRAGSACSLAHPRTPRWLPTLQRSQVRRRSPRHLPRTGCNRARRPHACLHKTTADARARGSESSQGCAQRCRSKYHIISHHTKTAHHH